MIPNLITEETISVSPRSDVIFLYANILASGVFLLLRSIRQCGMKCRVLLFSPDLYPQQHETILKSFNIERIIGLGELAPPKFARYYAERDWLRNHSHEVNKVFHSDAFDAFFQVDVFPLIDSRQLVFIAENSLIKSSPVNMKWLRHCFPANETLFEDRQVICSGTITGGAFWYLKFLEEFTTNIR
jgi:hypothetical protein